MSGVDVAALRVVVEAAHNEVIRLCGPGETWRMSIPANPRRDSDLLIAAVLERLPEVLDRLEAAEAQRDLLAKAMWDARTELGFDPDGDEKFHSTDWAGIAARHVQQAREVREEWEFEREVLDRAEAKLARVETLIVTEEARVAAINADLIATGRLGMGRPRKFSVGGILGTDEVRRALEGPQGAQGADLRASAPQSDHRDDHDDAEPREDRRP